MPNAIAPTAYVTQIPGRFASMLCVDKRNPTGITTSSTTSAQLDYIYRAETASDDFQVPINDVPELGTNLLVGVYDDLPDTKLSISAYDVSCRNLSLLTGQKDTTPGTTPYNFATINSAPTTDIIRQYADPNGNVFYSEFFGDLVIEEWGIAAKMKGTPMETYSLVGVTFAGFQGLIQTKAVVITSGMVTAGSFSTSLFLGTNENLYQYAGGMFGGGFRSGTAGAPTSTPHFIKVEKWDNATGFTRYVEVTGTTPPTVAASYSYNPTGTLIQFLTGDISAGDCFFLTYATYKTNVTSLSPQSGVSTSYSYLTINQNTVDTADPVAIPARLCNVQISANMITRAQSVDMKLTAKRTRAEGLGELGGYFGPSDAPSVAVDLEVNKGDMGLLDLIEYGSQLNSATGGASTNDWFDPYAAVNNQIATPMPLVLTMYSPLNSTLTQKTVTVPDAILAQRTMTTPAKGIATIKFSGRSATGQMTATGLL
jgi:hypothetical protein